MNDAYKDLADNMGLPTGLEQFFYAHPSIAVAFSGGMDSRFLCHAAMLCNVDVLAVHATGPHIAPEDSQYALDWAKKRGLPCVEIAIDPLALPEVSTNSRQRCYVCKQFLFRTLKQKLAELGENGRLVCDGGNQDDRGAYRPGLRVVQEAGIFSPLADAGLGKAEIRALGRKLALDNASQKARPCLLTRLAYGMKPDRQDLAAIAAAESEIAHLLRQNLGECDFRLRLLPRPELHLTHEAADLYSPLMAVLDRHGFKHATIRRIERLSGFFDAPRS